MESSHILNRSKIVIQSRMQRVVTLLDVAERANVSKTTVSNVFSHPERVRPELRAHIEEVAGRLGYQGPDPKGRLLSSGKVNAIGVVSFWAKAFSWGRGMRETEPVSVRGVAYFESPSGTFQKVFIRELSQYSD